MKTTITIGILLVLLLCQPVLARDGDISIRGTLSELTSDIVTVSGTTLPITPDTEYEDAQGNTITQDAFSIGDFVQLKGRPQNGIIVAHELELENENDDGDDDSSDDSSSNEEEIILRGVITTLSSGAVTVGSTTFLITSITEFEDVSDNSTTFDTFSVGDSVKVKAFVNEDGDLIAAELEHENDDDSSSGSGKGKGKGSSKATADSDRIKLQTRLRAVADTVTAFGKARRRARNRGDRQRDRFTSKVHIPVPSILPAVENLGDAESLDLLITLSRNGAPYAECEFEFDEVEEKNGQTVAEYKVDIRSRSRTGRRDRFREKKGRCDLNLNSGGMQSGVPAVRRGDIATVSDDFELEDILRGTF